MTKVWEWMKRLWRFSAKVVTFGVACSVVLAACATDINTREYGTLVCGHVDKGERVSFCCKKIPPL
jgi:hypothetical protein